MTDLPRPEPVFFASVGESQFGLKRAGDPPKPFGVRNPLLAPGGPVRKNARHEWHFRGWRLERLEISQTEFAPFCGSYTYVPGDAGPMPDFAPWLPTPVVHDDLRAIVQQADPDGSQFVPIDISAPAGMMRPGQRYLWLVKRRLWKDERQSFLDNLERIRLLRSFTAPNVPNAFHHDIRRMADLNGERIWPMITDKRLRNRMRLLPVWGFDMNIRNICIAAPLFKRLQAAGLSGLTLQSADHPYDAVQGEVFVGI